MDHPSRREFLQSTIALAGSAALPLAAAAQEPKPPRPNLVFFLGEGHRADALSIAGHPIVSTPHHSDPAEIDNLAGRAEHADLKKQLMARMEKLRTALPARTS